MPALRILRAPLLAVCLLLIVPALSAAETFTVDSVADQHDENPGDGICWTEAETCTLRAALEESNLDEAQLNTIDFVAAFDGGDGDTIQPGSDLPAITHSLTIDGASTGRCTTAAGVAGPCVGVDGQRGFVVQAEGVTIEGLAITQATVGIELDAAAEDFTANNNWFGVTLEGNPSGNTLGVLVTPGADRAIFGGTTTAARNVFGYNVGGLIVRGASETSIQGNYFGVEPDGVTEAHNGRNLAIADTPASSPTPLAKATKTTIGADVGEAGLETAACDLGCNVFAGGSASEAAIDLQGGHLHALGEAPSTGPTTIQGNYVGLDAAGAAVSDAPIYGILVGSAGGVTVGGSEPGEGNRIHGGYFGVFGTPSPAAMGLVVEGNTIGRKVDGSGSLFPPGTGIAVSSEGLDALEAHPRVAGNSISSTGTGIEQRGNGALIEANKIAGAGGDGIHVLGSTEPSGVEGLIEGNEILFPEAVGILIQNDRNRVLGNEIYGAEKGIVVRPEVTVDVSGNQIGGNTAAGENVISDVDFFPIELNTTEGSRNEIARNRGTENGLRFIALRPFNGDEGDPNGAKWPTITAARGSEAAGRALPGARVRVFRKASSAEGGIAGFLGEGIADSSGNWKAAYAAVPGGTIIAATQTNGEGGTSELSETATTVPDPPPPPCTVDCGGPALPPILPPPPAAEVVKPTVTIKGAPKARSSATTAKFRFVSGTAGAKFKCKLDKKAWANCRSPKTYAKLKPGKHVFKVKATDAAGNTGAVVTRKFTVLAP